LRNLFADRPDLIRSAIFSYNGSQVWSEKTSAKQSVSAFFYWGFFLQEICLVHFFPGGGELQAGGAEEDQGGESQAAGRQTAGGGS
jgi:hypothetical protein